MAEFDLVIRGGTIVDGTGLPRYRSDLAIKNGRVAMISGRIKAAGAKEIDARDCIVAPGAVDLHTHYDAQLNWDPYCTLSGWFGVTSLTIGQCGFGFAPTRPEDREQNMQMMNRIEAIPMESMRQGMRWDWETFPQYLDSLDGQGLGVNVAALLPFSPLRGYVLGMKAARERTSVTADELGTMKRIFREAMQAGAFGFAIDKNLEDRAEDGSYLPSHVASREELIGLAEVLGESGVGHIGWTIGLSNEQEAQRAMVADMARSSGRPVQVALGADPVSLAWLKTVREEGLPIFAQMSANQTVAEFTLAEYNLFDYMQSWVQPFVGTPAERSAKLRDPQTRAAMKRDVAARPTPRTDWGKSFVIEAVHERNRKFEGLTILELAAQTGKDPLDAFLDLALDEDLDTVFSHPISREPSETMIEYIKSPYSHVSLSDGGAHTRFLTQSVWPIFFLFHWVRDKDIMSLEAATRKISALPAQLADFRDRGMLRLGAWADIIVYKLDELGYLYPKPIFARDFPGNERRLIQKPTGLRYTLVNGVVTFDGNDCTGALPGKLLRSHEMVG